MTMTRDTPPGDVGEGAQRRCSPERRDLVVAAIAIAVDLTLWSDVVFTAPTDAVESTSRTVTIAFAAPGVLALMWRRCFPLSVFGTMCLHSIVCALLLTYRPIMLVCVALATVAARSTRRTVLGAFGCAVLTSGAWIVNEVRTSPEVTSSSGVAIVGVGYIVIVAIAVGVGRWQHANQQRVRDLERQRLEAAARARTTERLRVARELHDIVAHTVTIMVLQAAGARRVMGSDPQRAAQALSAVEDAGTQAMEELRRLLGVLRAGNATGSDDTATDVGTQQGLADLDTLLETFTAAGMRVRAEVVGAAGRLDPSVDLAAYRVVQEGLTNVTKHAGPTANVVVRVEWGESVLSVDIDDDGTGGDPARPALSTGHGLLGLRERVELVGGTLKSQAGPTGFRLTATLPLARRSMTGAAASSESEAVQP